MLTCPGVAALKGLFAARPAIVVAAGPTLDGALPVLQTVQRRAVIIAVGQALRPLLRHGIEPEFVVAVDSDPVTLRQYDDLPPHDRTWMVGGINLCPELTASYAERMFGFSHALANIQPWLAEIDALPGSLMVGGTVAVSAIDLAGQMGGDPSFFCGLDLAYRDDGTTHASSTQWDGEREATAHLTRVPGNYQDTVPTSKQFAKYITIMNTHLAQIQRQQAVTFYNATDGGARLEGTRLIRPAAIPERLPAGESPSWQEDIQHARKSYCPPDRDRVRDHVHDLLDELEQVQATCTAGRDHCRALGKPFLPAVRERELLEDLAAVDVQLKGYTQALQFLEGVVSNQCTNILNRQSSADDGSTADGARAGEQLYDKLLAGSELLADKINQSLTDFSHDPPAGAQTA